MRLLLAFLFLPALALGQSLPYSFEKSYDAKTPDAIDATSLQEDLEFLSNQVHQQKVVTSNLTVNGVVTAVGASSPLCSSGGTTPSLSLCGTVAGSSINGNISGDAANVTGVVPIANGGTNATSAPAALTSLGAFPAAGGTVTGQTTVSASTLTVTGQDSSGYSIKASSGINAGNGCILVQGGEMCGPVAGPTGPQGPAGQNGLLTFASDIVPYWIISSVGGSNYYALTVATDGALVVTSTTTASQLYNYSNVTRKYLSNGAFTSRITVDDSDGVLRMSPNTVTLRMTDLAVYDASGQVWDIGMDLDGAIRTTAMGNL